MSQRRIFALRQKGKKIKYYTSVTRLCRHNGLNYLDVAQIVGYPKRIDGKTISVLPLNPEDTKKGTYK